MCFLLSHPIASLLGTCVAGFYFLPLSWISATPISTTSNPSPSSAHVPDSLNPSTPNPPAAPSPLSVKAQVLTLAHEGPHSLPLQLSGPCPILHPQPLAFLQLLRCVYFALSLCPCFLYSLCLEPSLPQYMYGLLPHLFGSLLTCPLPREAHPI